MLTRTLLDLGDKIRISPPIWPGGQKLRVQPGDLTKFTPYGNGVYGYQKRGGGTPFTSAPSEEACGGVLYFGNEITRPDFEALMRITGVQEAWVANPSKKYAAFTAEAETPGKEGYLAQLRIVSHFALSSMFKAITRDEYDTFPAQELTVLETLWTFIEHERRRWGTSFMEDGRGLRGLFGGDGHFAREELAFGFMVENGYYNVYRICSRAWLVTK